MTDTKLLEECLEYFRNRPVYRKLFEAFQKKYAGLGHLGGSVTLTGLSPEDKAQLGGFLQKDYTENKRVTISGKLLEKSLASSRFAGLSWEDILEGYLGGPLQVRKELKEQEEQRRESFFRKIMEKRLTDPARSWLEQTLEDHGRGYSLLSRKYQESPRNLEELLKNFSRAVENLPGFSENLQERSEMAETERGAGKEAGTGRKTGKKELLPVFAARVTGDPHYFDRGTPGERLLTFFLEDLFEERGSLPKRQRAKAEGMTGAEYRQQLFYQAGLLTDELSNNVLAYGLRGFSKNGELHPGLQGFYEAGEPVKLTLQTLGGLEKIHSQENGPVYIVENPAVFALLVDKYPEKTLVCGNGQVNLAVLVLLDKLSESHKLYYAGDFDPEGLLIAQRLKRRYGDRLELWNYRADWYEKYLSEVVLNEARLGKLEHVELEELWEIKEAMKRRKRAAYQEAMPVEIQ